MALSQETIMQLHNSALDCGANFLIGASTSPFDPNFSYKTAGIMSTIGGTIGVAASASNIVGSAINTAALSANIVAEGLQDLNTKLTEYVAKSTVKIMSIPMEKFGEAMQKEIKEKTLKVKDIIKQLTQGAEDFDNAYKKTLEENQNAEIKSKALLKVKEISYTVSAALVKAQKELTTIAYYVAKGPNWMQNQVDKYSYLVMQQVVGNVDKTVESFEETKDKWAETAGKTVGSKAVEPINAKLIETQKGIIEKVEIKKKEMMAKAGAAMAKAIMKIKGLLGG